MPPAKRKIIFVLKELALKSRSNHIELRFFVNSFGQVDFYAKIFPMLYPPLENSTTHITIIIGRSTIISMQQMWYEG